MLTDSSLAICKVNAILRTGFLTDSTANAPICNLIALELCITVPNGISFSENRIYAKIEILYRAVLYLETNTYISLVAGIEICKIGLFFKNDVNGGFLLFLSYRISLCGKPYHLLESRVDKYLHTAVGKKLLCNIFSSCGEKIKGVDPFLTEKSVQAMDDETLVIQGNKILVRPYILPHISKLTSDEIKMLGGKEGLRKQQGFYVYRNKRLLVWGTWFRMMRQGDLSKLARIRVDIPNTLDDLWTLDIKKSSALPPAEVRKNLEIIINQIAERSKRTWTFRGKKEISDTETHVWNRLKNKQGGFYYEVNREHPLVQQMIKAHPDIEVSLNALLQQIEMGLPLNQLYVDLNNDEQITNDNEQSDVEIVKSLQEMITMCADKQEKCNLLVAIACIDPYSSHLDIVEKLKEEILKND